MIQIARRVLTLTSIPISEIIEQMNTLPSVFRTLCCLLLLTAICVAQTSQFTYQGKLTDGGAPANGQYDLTFKLFDLLSGGTQIGSDVVRDDVQVTNGVFTVNLDFGSSPFTQTSGNYLEISVRPGASTGAFTVLSPRQLITSTPYAVKTLRASSATVADNVSGVVGIFNGGTGLSFNNSFPPAGLFLRTDGTGWSASGLQSLDIPGGSSNYIQNRTTPQASTNFNISGNGTVGGILSGNGSGLTNLTGLSLNPKSITARELDDLSVTSTALGDGAVSTDKIQDGAVTGPKIASGAAGTVKWNVITVNSQAQSNNGYLANGAGEVRVRLPVAPNAGDIIRVSASDIGAWKITQNAGQTIARFRSDIPLSWTPRDTDRNWKAVASSADGSKLVAVVLNGQIYTSTDSGASWVPVESVRSWRSVASSADGSKLVAVANPAQIYTSTDSGASWTPRETSRGWMSVASSVDGSRLVAVVNNGQIYTSTDSGVNWTPRDSNRAWRSVASSSDGVKLVAVGFGELIFTSTDSGATWIPHAPVKGWTSVASSADGSKLVAVADSDQIYTSIDSGANWAPRESIRDWRGVASSSDGIKLIATVSNGQIYISTDSGANWSTRESNRVWESVASSADGTKLVAVNSAGGAGGKIYTASSSPQITTSGSTGFISGGALSAVELQYIGGGKFIWLSHEGEITIF